MIVLSNSTSQTLAPGQAMTFDTVVLHTGCGECYRNGSGSVGLKAKNGIYDCSIKADLGGETAATPVQLSVCMSGSPLMETLMTSTPDTVGALNNASAGTSISTGCCDGGTGYVTVVNTGTANIVIGAHPCLRIRRVA